MRRRESLRSRNGQAVVAAVYSRPRSSRADFARVTGLSTSAVSTLVADLIEAEVLVELGTKASDAGGRPAVALGLAPRAGSLVGIHLGQADLRVVLTSLDGTVLMQQRHFLDVGHEPAASLDQLARSTADLLATGDVDRARVLAAGGAVSAPVVDSRCWRRRRCCWTGAVHSASRWMPRSFAICAIGRPLSTTRRTARSRNSSGYFFGAGIAEMVPLPRMKSWLGGLRQTRPGSIRSTRRRRPSTTPSPRSERARRMSAR